MTYHEPLSQIAVAISISESDDLDVLGLAQEHLRDAMTEISRHLLAMGARLVYGGDLRASGYTTLLYELVSRHRRDADVGDIRPAVLSYLPWPVHAMKAADYLLALRDELAGIGELHCLDRQGREIAVEDLPSAPHLAFSDAEWTESLTAMRAVQTQVIDARVVLGGRVTNFKGRMPGIAEETLFALQSKQPLYLMGGFGGSARDIAQDIGLLAGETKSGGWRGREEFSGFRPTDMFNGLDAEENRTLARTVHVDQAIALILRGMLRLTLGISDDSAPAALNAPEQRRGGGETS